VQYKQEPIKDSTGNYLTNVACKGVTGCSTKHYETAKPTATSNRVCALLKVCTPDEFESTAPKSEGGMQVAVPVVAQKCPLHLQLRLPKLPTVALA